MFPDVAIPHSLLTPYVLDSIQKYEGAAVCLEDGVTGEVVTYDQVSQVAIIRWSTMIR